MNSSFRVRLETVLALVAVSLLVFADFADGQEKATHNNTTAQIELLLAGGESKIVSVALEQSAREVFNLCKPAKVYADDDPWLGYMAAGGGYYVVFFYAEGTPKEMSGRLDPSRDKLYAVVRYPTESRDDGVFLLPEEMRNKTCGDFVTLKVPLGPDIARVGTVALGISTEDVMRLFRPAPDHAEEDHAILMHSIHDGGRYLFIFSRQDHSSAHDRKLDKLSQVMYWPGGQTESIFLLPRKKRSDPLRAELVDAAIAMDQALRSKPGARLGSHALLRDDHFDWVSRRARWGDAGGGLDPPQEASARGRERIYSITLFAIPKGDVLRDYSQETQGNPCFQATCKYRIGDKSVTRMGVMRDLLGFQFLSVRAEAKFGPIKERGAPCVTNSLTAVFSCWRGSA